MHSTLLIVGPSLSLPTKENEIRTNVGYLYMQIYLLRLLIYLYGKLGSDFAGVTVTFTDMWLSGAVFLLLWGIKNAFSVLASAARALKL